MTPRCPPVVPTCFCEAAEPATAPADEQEYDASPVIERADPSVKEKRRRQQARVDLRDRLRSSLAAKAEAARRPGVDDAGPPPRYDDVFEQGVAWLDSLAGEPWKSSTPVLVGELNPYSDRPAMALYDLPVGATGDRLRRLVCGVTPSRYRAFSRHDLCVREWSAGKAQVAAAQLAASYRGRVLVLLGRKVAGAFGLGAVEPYTLHRPHVLGAVQPAGTVYVLLPHPSGLNRAWAVPGAFARARAVLAEACPAIPWGEADCVSLVAHGHHSD